MASITRIITDAAGRTKHQALPAMIAAALLLADSDFGNHMNDWGAGWWVLMAMMMIVFWGLVILGAVWLVRTLVHDRRGHPGPSAAELLDRRLANGEISPEEYRERRAVLRGGEESGSGG
jgi:putative membrane protein